MFVELKAPIVLIVFLTRESSLESAVNNYKYLFSSSAKQIQEFIDKYISHRTITTPLQSALITLTQRMGTCLESAFLAALFLENKYGTKILSLHTNKNIGHALYLFEEDESFGTIGNSSREDMKWRKAIYKNIKELSESFREPLNEAGYILTSFDVENLATAMGDWRYSLNNLGTLDEVIRGNRSCYFGNDCGVP